MWKVQKSNTFRKKISNFFMQDTINWMLNAFFLDICMNSVCVGIIIIKCLRSNKASVIIESLNWASDCEWRVNMLFLSHVVGRVINVWEFMKNNILQDPKSQCFLPSLKGQFPTVDGVECWYFYFLKQILRSSEHSSAYPVPISSYSLFHLKLKLVLWGTWSKL